MDDDEGEKRWGRGEERVGGEKEVHKQRDRKRDGSTDGDKFFHEEQQQQYRESPRKNAQNKNGKEQSTNKNRKAKRLRQRGEAEGRRERRTGTG